MAPRGVPNQRVPGRLSALRGLAPEDLRAIEQLAETCVAADGGRLKLEWRTLSSRASDEVNDFVWNLPEGLVGFLGVYGFRSDQVELCGMVHPAHRRRGIFSRLFQAASAELEGRGVQKALLVVDRLYQGGAGFAGYVGGSIEHSEHRMVLRREPAPFVPDPLVKLRLAEMSDVGFIVDCLAEAFDLPIEQLDREAIEALAKRFQGTVVIERGNERVGTIRVERGQDSADVYGFAVTSANRGRGIGRQALSTIVGELAAEGIARVGLEVSSTNDSALVLYVSCGFDVTGTEDYYEVTFPAN
jgi:ribosomal protein S18 acetylase RimI-like enzyme